MEQPDTYSKERALRLIQSERLLKKVMDKAPAHYDKDVTIKSIFRSLILPDKAMMEKYRKTYTQ